tara:strand:- start:145 stop:303 length:159 start_codon:yes stop_codon:yes gene_type:complete
MAKLKGKARAKSRAKKFDPELIGGTKTGAIDGKRTPWKFKDFYKSVDSLRPF